MNTARNARFALAKREQRFNRMRRDADTPDIALTGLIGAPTPSSILILLQPRDAALNRILCPGRSGFQSRDYSN